MRKENEAGREINIRHFAGKILSWRGGGILNGNVMVSKLEFILNYCFRLFC